MQTQKRHQPVLILCQVCILPCNIHAVLGIIDREVARPENAGICHCLAAGRRSGVADGSADSRQQLSGAERLCQIVVRARVQSFDLIALVRPRGDHQNRHLRPPSDLAQNLHPVNVRQPQIENDHVRTVRGNHALAHRARARQKHIIIVCREDRLHKITDGLLVFNYQNLLSDLHSFVPPVAV